MPRGYGPARHTKPNVWDKALALKVYRGGEKIDPGVNYFVLMLDQMGLPTTFSCQGHGGEFYVTFYGPYEAALEIERTGFFSVEIEGENYWSIRRSPDREGSTVDAMRWAADSWEKHLGPLNFEDVDLER